MQVFLLFCLLKMNAKWAYQIEAEVHSVAEVENYRLRMQLSQLLQQMETETMVGFSILHAHAFTSI